MTMYSSLGYSWPRTDRIVASRKAAWFKDGVQLPGESGPSGGAVEPTGTASRAPDPWASGAPAPDDLDDDLDDDLGADAAEIGALNPGG